MDSYPQRRLKIHQLTIALFLIFAILAKDLKADTSSGEQTKAETKSNPFHLSWTSRTGQIDRGSRAARLDFVFILNGTINDAVKLESDPNNFLTDSLKSCIGHSACLFRNGTYIESFDVHNEKTHETVFTSVPANQSTPHAKSPSNECDINNKLKIVHYCTTHWNPPNHFTRNDCDHIIHWHSPITCPSNTNQERPCYIYEPSGKLIDLTPWVLSNGTSYKVDTGNNPIKEFNINICNEAHEPCGPNVAACFFDEHSNVYVETGYNNLTSIKYDEQNQVVLLTSLGHYEQHCDDSRIKTVIRFICKNKIVANSRPKLVESTACENIIEWPSVHACPVSHVKRAEKECNIKYAPLGIDIDITKITNNSTQVEIPGIKVDGKDKKMIVGICKTIPKEYGCEGKYNSNTQACLIDSNSNSTVFSASNSKIVGSAMGASIRLSDEKIYLESYAMNSTCFENVRENFNVTQQVGTRIEFVCSSQSQDKPIFLGYDDCTYVFEWGSPLMCLEAFSSSATVVQTNQTTSTNATKQVSNINIKDVIESGGQKSEFKKQDVASHGEMKPSKSNTPLDDQPKMNGIHKFFMISLIVMSFAAFIVVIFVLDKKTRLRVTLKQARRAFQPHQQPYLRVIDDLDL